MTSAVRPIPALSQYIPTPTLRALAATGLVLLLCGCGGGLGGSGDGGDKSSGSILIPLPDGFEAPYQLVHVPERLIADFPRSLATTTSEASSSDTSAFRKLRSTVSDLISRKVEIGQLQLLLDANWQALLDHCSTTPIDSACTLDSPTLSTPYSPSMASWEYQLRAAVTMEMLGVETLPDSVLDENASLVTSRIGTALSIEGGTFRELSSGAYRYEVILTTDLGFGSAIYTSRWSKDLTLTFLSIAEVAVDGVEALQSSTRQSLESHGFNNSILVTRYMGEDRTESQLNLNQLDARGQLQVESQLTEFLASSRDDTYSIGTAGDAGGYLRSERQQEDADNSVESDFLRESFTEEGLLDSQSICRNAVSEARCDADDLWEVLTPRDPILSQFFLSETQLTELESRLKPFELQIQGVSPDPDVLILIRRENLSISVSAGGIIIKVPGLGTIDLTGNTVESEVPDGEQEQQTDLFSQYADSMLCRVNRVFVNQAPVYRSFCAGTTEEIQDALVIGESFTDGELVIEWQANADIRVIEN